MKVRLKKFGDEIREKTFYLAIPAALLLISACSVGPDYVRPALETPAAYKETEAAKDSQSVDDVVSRSWWEIFADPELNSLEQQVEISNQNVAQAEAQFRQARALVQAARAALFSDRDGGCRYNSQRAIGNGRLKHREKQPNLHGTFLARRCLLGVGCLGSHPAHRRIEPGDRSSQRGRPGGGNTERARRIGRRIISNCARWMRRSNCSTIPRSPLTNRCSSPTTAIATASPRAATCCKRRPS